MYNDRFAAETFGGDCLGNPTGWLVRDRESNSVIAEFVANIYEANSHKLAHHHAFALAAALNNATNVYVAA